MRSEDSLESLRAKVVDLRARLEQMRTDSREKRRATREQGEKYSWKDGDEPSRPPGKGTLTA
jgi:hypothetical protein